MSWSSPVPYSAIINAKKHAAEGELGLACSLYLFAFSLDHSLESEYSEEFQLLFREWCDRLEKKKRYKDLFECYKQALSVLPDDVHLLNNFGSYLLKFGSLNEAAHYFRECIDIDPDFLRAAHNLDDVLIQQVERWHFKMLNDQNRNEAFKEAITKKIRQGFDRVLDVGTGTGLFSLFCHEGKAKKIYACDVSPTMIDIASQVFLFNDASDITLIRKHSCKLQVPEDIDERVSLLVTETFDVALLGEHILLTLTHAWENLLLPPHPQTGILDPFKFGMVIPCKAITYVTGIQFDKLANDFHLKRTNNLNWGLFENWNVLQSCDQYDSQDLSRAQCKFLTETEKMFEINFNDPDALREFLKGWHKDMTLKCKSHGRLDCFAVWFDLHLDEDIVLSTSPVTKTFSAWDQAVFLLPRSVPVAEEQDINITVSFDSNNLNISLSGNRIDDQNFVASEDVIRMLNNEKLAKEFHQVLHQIAPSYTDSVSILDYYPFPIFGLNFLKLRSDKFEDQLTCFVPTKEDQKLVNCMAEKYGIKIDVLIKKKTDFQINYLEDKKFDIILLDFIEMTGEIKDEILLHLDFLKSLLKPGGIILPKHVTVIGQFIYSDWLTKVSTVSNDSVTCGYKIAKYINEYQVQRFVDFDLKSSDSIACSEPFELFDLLNSESRIEKEVPSKSSVEFFNAMVYWLKIRFRENSEEVLTIDDAFCHQVALLFPKTMLSSTIHFYIYRDDGLFTVDLTERPDFPIQLLDSILMMMRNY